MVKRQDPKTCLKYDASTPKAMKVIIAGSRNLVWGESHVCKVKHLLSNYFDFEDKIHLKDELELVSGMCHTGADQIPVLISRQYGIPLKEFPAHWSKNGKAAGPMRNRKMAEYADALIAFWDGKSHGTKNMIKEAEKRGLMIRVIDTIEL